MRRRHLRGVGRAAWLGNFGLLKETQTCQGTTSAVVSCFPSIFVFSACVTPSHLGVAQLTPLCVCRRCRSRALQNCDAYILGSFNFSVSITFSTQRAAPSRQASTGTLYSPQRVRSCLAALSNMETPAKSHQHFSKGLFFHTGFGFAQGSLVHQQPMTSPGRGRALATIDDTYLPQALLQKIAPRLVDRARLALVNKRWASLLDDPSFWAHLSFEGAEEKRPISDDAVLQLCRRAGGQLRSLDLPASRRCSPLFDK